MNGVKQQLMVLTILMALVFSVTAVAVPPGDGHRGALRRLKADLQTLNLTPEQSQKVDAVFAQIEPEVARHRTAMQQGRQAIRKLVDEGGDGVIDKVRPLAEEQGKHFAELVILKARMHADINAVLSAEQRTQLTTLIDSRPRRGGRGGRMGPGQPAANE